MITKEKCLRAMKLWVDEELGTDDFGSSREPGEFAAFCERHDLDDGLVHDIMLTALDDVRAPE
jgi:hypothetical protein